MSDLLPVDLDDLDSFYKLFNGKENICRSTPKEKWPAQTNRRWSDEVCNAEGAARAERIERTKTQTQTQTQHDENGSPILNRRESDV